MNTITSIEEFRRDPARYLQAVGIISPAAPASVPSLLRAPGPTYVTFSVSDLDTSIATTWADTSIYDAIEDLKGIVRSELGNKPAVFEVETLDAGDDEDFSYVVLVIKAGAVPSETRRGVRSKVHDWLAHHPSPSVRRQVTATFR